MATKPKENLFYFEEEEEEPPAPEVPNSSNAFSPNKTLTKQLYKIEDTNKLSVNFFERDNLTDEQEKAVVLTNNARKKTGKKTKLSIPAMDAASNSA